MTGDALARLLADGAIERVAPDRPAAGAELDVARRHLESAALLASSDPTAAFAVGWEAIRKAVAAHMRARGVRARRGPGQHERTGRYARAALAGAGIDPHLDAIDDLRLLRNQSQYEGLAVEPAEVHELLAHARAIVGAIRDDLGP